MPFAGYKDFEECLREQKENGKDEESAKRICGYIKHRTEDEKDED